MLSEKRLAQLKEHLEKLEKETGAPLLTMPRRMLPGGGAVFTTCPIYLFAPSRDKDGNTFYGAGSDGVVRYDNPRPTREAEYRIYGEEQSLWWDSISRAQRKRYTNATIKWLNER